MGGYDGQTLAGVISTSTHGSGLRFGPLPDLVCAIDVIAGGDPEPRKLRIEPGDGPTEPGTSKDRLDGFELVQDDGLFYAATVGMGCLGVIYALTIRVRDAFALTEVRTVSTWEAVRDQLPDGPELRGSEHWELFVNPYPGKDGTHKCVITKRTPPQPGDDPDFAGRHRPWLNEVLSALPITHGVMNLVLDLDPDGTPAAMDHALDSMADAEFTGRSFKVLNIGGANRLPAYSSEIGIELAGDKPQRAVERIFEIAAQHARLGDVHHTSPFSLRFVKGSPSFLSMMEGRDTMMIELIQQTDTEGGFELLEAHENALYALGGRPHWGQVNHLTEPMVRALYTKFDNWLAARDHLDPRGVFNAPFTKRVGISTLS
jgi:FAD/FMN-containing dehydrogenase